MLLTEVNIDADISRLETKIDESVDRLETKIDADISRLETKIDESVGRLETKMDQILIEMQNLGNRLETAIMEHTHDDDGVAVFRRHPQMEAAD